MTDYGMGLTESEETVSPMLIRQTQSWEVLLRNQGEPNQVKCKGYRDRSGLRFGPLNSASAQELITQSDCRDVSE
jgi:hypothetical protein